MIGNLKISKFTRKSCDLVYEFYKDCSDDINQNLLFIGIPGKDILSLIISIDVLSKLLKDDLEKVKVNAHLRTLKPKDKIIFFGKARAEFISYKEKYIHFYSKGFETYGNKRMPIKERNYLPLIYGNYLRKYNGRAKTYHLLTDILSAASDKRGRTGAREKLFLRDKYSRRLGVPSGLFKSKVLLVTGRGNKVKFDNLTEKIQIYEESIKSIFDGNLIIKKNLEKYKNIFSEEATHERLRYDKFANDQLWRLIDDYPELEDDIFEILLEFEKGSYNKQELLDLKNNFKIIYDKEPEIFNVLLGRLPKSSITLPSNLKLVVINSMEVLQNYQRVIQGFKKRGIKVICTFDLFDFSIHNPFPNSPSYFWNRSRIKKINSEERPSSDESNSFTDKELWYKALTYSLRKYKIYIYDDDGFAKLYWKIYRSIKVVDGKENLVDLFWKKIYPLYYLLKNSPNIEEYIKLKYLNQIKNELENLVDKSELQQLFLEFIRRVETFKNRKILQRGNIFAQEINFGSEKLYIPNNRNIKKLKFHKNLRCNVNRFIFTGIPYRDYQLKIIDNIIKNCHGWKLHFLCWKNEYSYVKKIIEGIEKSSWKEDSLITKIAKRAYCPLDIEEVKVISKKDLRDEVLDQNENDHSYEEESKAQSNYYHSKYKGIGETYRKKSITVFLKSNKRIYIPIKDKVYYLTDEESSIKQKKVRDLRESDTLILFKISKEDIRKIGSENENIDEVFNDLEIWSNALESLYKSCGKNYGALEQKLMRYKTNTRPKANPNRTNIIRWLDDNDLTLAPWDDNLEVILEAAGLLHKKNIIKKANKKIRSYEAKLKEDIKKEIFIRVNEFLVEEDEIITKEIFIDGVSVKITTCKVFSIDKEIVDIDNNYVKLILKL